MIEHKKRNFCSGPAHMPKAVIDDTIQALSNFRNTGLSITEIYHRDLRYIDLLGETKALLNNLCDLQDQFEILFLTGGATALFGTIPANLLSNDRSAAFIDTGRWAAMAMDEASLYGQVKCIASSADSQYDHIPMVEGLNDLNDAYLHITSNNTVMGSQYQNLPDTNIPLVVDMSSDILSRPCDYQKASIIYAGAQKNLGAAGVTICLIKKDMLKDGPVRSLQRTEDLSKHIAAASNLNTPPVLNIYIVNAMLHWIESEGKESLWEANQKKADLLYKELDRNSLFEAHVKEGSRSNMNVTFNSSSAELEASFKSLAADYGFEQISGHRSIGGMRVALYNAIPFEWVEDLVELMQLFEEQH